MQSKAATVEQYLAELPPDRRAAIATLRKVIRANLPKGYEELMQYGMIAYSVPHSLYPPGYHCDPKQPLSYVCLASQKNYISLYLSCIYCEETGARWFREAWTKATGKKPNMGKSCVRFASLDGVPLELVGQAIKRMPVKEFIAFYEGVLKDSHKKRGKSAAGKSAAKKPASRRKSPPKAAAKTATKARSRKSRSRNTP